MPDDTTPHGGEAMHPPPDRAKIPEPEPGSTVMREDDAPDARAMKDRPELPSHSLPAHAANDESVGRKDRGDAIGRGTDANDTGKPSVTRQPGEGS